MDYSKYQTTSAIPEASSMIETFRAIGYNIETAIADIIDNSISANAKNVWVNFEWLGEKTWLSITDDGIGMDSEEIIQAMRPGSKNPLIERDSKDLGRFGLGLKTASFSQARKLTVISKKKETDFSHWTWDLEFVKSTGKWDLIKYDISPRYEQVISDLTSGTIVLWNDIDRLVKDFKVDDEKALDKFLQTMDMVKKHLGMVFHRYIEKNKIKVYFQNRIVEPWNPFLSNEQATQEFPDEYLQNGKVLIKGYVLPHKSKISDETYKNAEGVKGWNEQQGFYIYRNQRMLLAGEWIGLFRKEEHYKLSRILIELPNTLDADWQIDIKKSIARPPLILREHIKQYALKVRQKAVEVYRHRGKYITQIVGQKYIPLWIEQKRGDKWFYKINRENPIVSLIKVQAKRDSDKAIEMLLRFIEETIPSKSIYIKESEQPELQGSPFEDTNHEIIRTTMQGMYYNLLNQGKKDEEAKTIISNIEPFNNFAHFLEFLK